MTNSTLTVLSTATAALALLGNPYMRFVRGWAMQFGPMLLLGLFVPVVLGAVGVVAGLRTERPRLLATLNVVCVAVGLGLGYVG